MGKHFLYRTGAAFVSTRLGVRSKLPISASELALPDPREMGGLIIAGSYVPKTTAQLKVLMNRRGETGKLAIVEMEVDELLASSQSAAQVVERVIKETERRLLAGMDTLVMTSRKLVTGKDELDSLRIGAVVAEALVGVLRGVEVRPRYIIAKVCSLSFGALGVVIDDDDDCGCVSTDCVQGGITSSDAATKGLNFKRATIVGQAAPGVPMWRCDEPTSRHRGVPFVVFPGNVGGKSTLCELVEGWS